MGNTNCHSVAYTLAVPRLWEETVEAHRREVRDAIIDTTATLMAEHGLLAVTMSRIAEDTGIGRATLYKYFASVEDVLLAWHQRQVISHLEQLVEVRDRGGTLQERLEAVLAAYAQIQRQRGQHHRAPHSSDLVAFLHRDPQLAPAERRLHDMIHQLLAQAADAGEVRADVAPDELASYCRHALGAAAELRSRAAVRRLVATVLQGLRPPDA